MGMAVKEFPVLKPNDGRNDKKDFWWKRLCLFSKSENCLLLRSSGIRNCQERDDSWLNHEAEQGLRVGDSPVDIFPYNLLKSKE